MIDNDAIIARALEDTDLDTLVSAIGTVRASDSLVYEFIEAALARRYLDAIQAGTRAAGPDEAWARETFRRSAMRRFVFQSALAATGTVLDEHGVDWMPIKGMDTSTRFFDVPEDRPMCDIDLLVRTEDYLTARRALEANGWKSRYHGSHRYDEFILREGYHWELVDRWGTSLELHFRLWGTVGDTLVEHVWSEAVRDERRGTRAWRMSATDALLLTAVHYWFRARRILSLWELHRIMATNPAMAPDILAIARREGLQLPASLAMTRAGHLFGNEHLLSIGQQLGQELRFPERIAAWKARRFGITSVSLVMMYGARVFAGRPSRLGFRKLYRRFFVHPGMREIKEKK